jgi:hypothetical protein
MTKNLMDDGMTGTGEEGDDDTAAKIEDLTRARCPLCCFGETTTLGRTPERNSAETTRPGSGPATSDSIRNAFVKGEHPVMPPEPQVMMSKRGTPSPQHKVCEETGVEFCSSTVRERPPLRPQVRPRPFYTVRKASPGRTKQY